MTSMMTARRGVMAKPTFSPASIAGLAAWYDASTLTGLANGDPVPSWSDRSSSGLTMAQGTASARPTYITGAVNSLPVVRFDGVDDMLLTAATALNLSADVSLFVVVKTSDTSGCMIAKDAGAGPTGEFIYMQNPKPIAERPYGASGTLATNAISTTGYHVVDVTITSTSVAHFLDGAANGTSTMAAGANVTQPLRLGATLASGALYFAGDLAEIVMYNTGLGATNRRSVEGYLGTKYGITVV